MHSSVQDSIGACLSRSTLLNAYLAAQQRLHNGIRCEALRATRKSAPDLSTTITSADVSLLTVLKELALTISTAEHTMHSSSSSLHAHGINTQNAAKCRPPAGESLDLRAKGMTDGQFSRLQEVDR